MLSEPSKDLPKKPESSKNLEETIMLCILAFSLPMGLCGLKIAPILPKRAPRGVQEGPMTAQEAYG